MRTSASLNTIRVSPIKKDTEISLDDIDGFSLLEHFYAYAKELERGTGIRDEVKGRYLRITSVEARGHCVLIETESGSFGESANTYDTLNGEIVRKNKSHEAFARTTRSALYMVPKSPFAVYVKEHKFGAQTGWMVMEQFRHALIAEIPGFYLPVETVQEDVSWKESADLEEVRVVMHHTPLDLSTGIDGGRKSETVAGRLAYSALPPRGVRYFSKKVLRGIFSGTLDPVSFVGLRPTYLGGPDGGGDPDKSVLVKLSRDGQTKTFELGKEGTPMVREMLSDHGEPALTSEEFFKKSMDMTADLYDRENYNLHRKQYTKSWAKDRVLPSWPVTS